jgi:hypothetical protein
MSSIYFGSVPSSNQLVSKENSLRGINLCRQAPSALTIVGIKDYTHPNYELYVNHLSAAIKSARDASPVSFSTTEYFYDYNGKNVPSYVTDPLTLWSYGDKKPLDFLNTQKARFNASETSAGGKPALSARMTVQQIRDLIKDTSPLRTTPFSVSAINIEGYLTYRRLHALSHAILRVQQYPLTGSSTKATNDKAQLMVAIPNDALEVPAGWSRSYNLRILLSEIDL